MRFLLLLALSASAFAQWRTVPTIPGKPAREPVICSASVTANCVPAKDASGNLSIVATLPASGITMSDGSMWTSGRPYLRNWQNKTAEILGNTANTVASIVYIGDSWTSQNTITWPLYKRLGMQYGDSGVGYVELDSVSAAPTGASNSTLGTWADANPSTTPGVNGMSTTSTDAATPGTKTVTATALGFTIHYVKKANGAQFRYKVDAGGWTTVDTANATTVFATTPITSLSNASHTLTIEVVNPLSGAAGVTLLGVDCQITYSGVRVHRIGKSGSKAEDWAALDETMWKAALTALDPTVVVLMFGTNERAGNQSPTTQSTHLQTLITRIKAAVPLADIVLAPPTDTSIADATYSVAEYVMAQRSLAATNSIGFVDAYKVIGDYATANTRGLYTNETHPNVAGGRAIAAVIEGYLTAGVQATVGGIVGIGQSSLAGALPAAVNNVGVGKLTLGGVTTGTGNTAVGTSALSVATTPANNSAFGYLALSKVTTGTGNTAVGALAGYPNNVPTTGTYNTYIGYNAGHTAGNHSYSTILGAMAVGNCDNCVVLGRSTDTSLAGTLYLNTNSEPTCMTATDLVVDGATNTKVTSASHNFVAGDVGRRLQVTAGAGWTAGDYWIVSTASNAATLHASPAAVGSTGGTYTLNRGLIVSVEGAAGAADTLRICRKDAANAMAWTALY